MYDGDEFAQDDHYVTSKQREPVCWRLKWLVLTKPKSTCPWRHFSGGFYFPSCFHARVNSVWIEIQNRGQWNYVRARMGRKVRDLTRLLKHAKKLQSAPGGDVSPARWGSLFLRLGGGIRPPPARIGQVETGIFEQEVTELTETGEECPPRLPLLPPVHETAFLGRDRLGRDRSGRDRSGRDRSGRDRSGRDRSGRDRSGRDRSGRDRSGRDKSGRDKSDSGIFEQEVTELTETGEECPPRLPLLPPVHETAFLGRDRSGRDNSGRDNSGRDNSGRDNSGRDNSGRDDSGRDNSGRDNSGRDNSGRDNSGRDGVPAAAKAGLVTPYDLGQRRESVGRDSWG